MEEDVDADDDREEEEGIYKVQYQRALCTVKLKYIKGCILLINLLPLLW